jgi:chromosome segregation protein
MTVVCPNCSVSLSVRRSAAGHHVRCKSCQHKFLVENVVESPLPGQHEIAEGDLFDRLYRELEEREEAETPSRASEAPRASDGELAELREQRDKLRDELAALQEDHAHVRSDRDSVLAQLEEIRGEHLRLVSEHEHDRNECQRLRAELESMRDTLGDVPAGAVGELRKERDSLIAEVGLLSSQVENLKADLSARGELANVIAQREEELRAALANAEKLNQQNKHLDDALGRSRADRDQLDRRIEELEQSLTTSCAGHEETARRLQGREDELAAKFAEIEKLLALKAEDEGRAQDLRGARAKREDQLQEECDRARVEIGQLRRLLDEAERAPRDDRLGLEEELSHARKQFASADSERVQLQARVNQLLETLEKLKADHEAAAQREQVFNAARHQVEQLREQVRQLDDTVNASRGERDQLNRRIQELDQDLMKSRTRHEELTGKLQKREDELAAKCVEMERLLALRTEIEGRADDLHGALAEREEELKKVQERLESADLNRAGLEARVNELLESEERLKAKHFIVGEREQELNEARARVEQLQAQVQQLDAAVKGSRAERDRLDRRIQEIDRALMESRARHEELTGRSQKREDELAAKCAEIERLIAVAGEHECHAADSKSALSEREEELRRAEDRLEAATSARTDLETRAKELTDTVEKLRADHHEAVERERSRITAGFESKLEAERRQHAAQLAEVEARAAENVQLVSRLKAEILALSQSKPAPDADLEAARMEIADLQRKLDETEISKRSMSSLLEGMGIRIH